MFYHTIFGGEDALDQIVAVLGCQVQFVGERLHPFPGSVEEYPSPEEPPTPETSEDILDLGSLRRNACGEPWKGLMLTTRLVMLSVCRGWDTGGGPQAKKGGNLRPSRVRGWQETRPGRGTSGPARLRNLRHESVGGSAIGRRIQASDQLKP